MNAVLWIIQALLALAFLMVGGAKLTQPIATLSKRMPWATSIPERLVRFIGLVELLGGIGLILPMLTGILPWLTVAAAGGLVLVMISATVFHLVRHEAASVPTNLVLLLLLLVVLVGRVAIVPA